MCFTKMTCLIQPAGVSTHHLKAPTASLPPSAWNMKPPSNLLRLRCFQLEGGYNNGISTV